MLDILIGSVLGMMIQFGGSYEKEASGSVHYIVMFHPIMDIKVFYVFLSPKVNPEVPVFSS
jgi:hypothetical protein